MSILYGDCPICKWKDVPLTEHHILKKQIWPELRTTENNLSYICQECHDAINEVLRLKENALLKEHPEIYYSTLHQFLSGEINPAEVIKELHKRNRRRKTNTKYRRKKR